MADLVAKLEGEDRLTPILTKVKKELGDTSRNASKLDAIQQKFDKISNSTAPLKKRLADTKKLLAEMNLDGLNNTDLFITMAQQAGSYADALGDASTAVKQFSNDTMNLQAAAQGMQLVTASASVLTGAMGMLGVEDENVNAAILKVQSSLAILNGVQTIANVLNKDSILMLKLKALATTGASVTTTTFTAALSKAAIVEALATAKTKISTIAQTAWNVAKAIGMAMLGNFTGLALLAVGAVVGLAVATKSSTDAEEENNESKKKLITSTEQLADKNREAMESIVTSEAKAVASYLAMQTAWKNLGDEHEKATWLTENKSKFQQLGMEVDNVSEAEQFFGAQSSKVIAALMARAKAAALYELYLKALQKQYELNHQSTVTFNWTYEGEVGGEDYNNKKQQAYEAACRQLQEDRRAQNQFVEQIKGDLLEAQREADEAQQAVANFNPTTRPRGNNGGNNGGNNNNNTVKLTVEMDNLSLKFAQDMLRQLENERIEIPTDATERLAENAAAIEAWKKEVEARKLILYPEVEFAEGSLEYAEDMLSKAQAAIKSIDIDIISPEDLALAMSNIDKWTQEVQRRKIALGLEVEEPKESTASIAKPEENKFFESGSIEDMRQSLQNARSIIEQIKSDYKDGLIDADAAKQQIDSINQQLQQLGLQPIELKVETDGSILTVAEQLEQAKERVDTILGAVDTLGGAFNTMGGAIGGTAGDVLSFAGTTMQAIAQMLPQIAALIGGSFAQAMAQGTASGSALPFPANLAAIASIVATIAGVAASAMSMKNKFADGGIVTGSTYHGDRILAGLNAGEMVLNKPQQSNLYRMLKNGNNNASGGKVEFTISGTTLKGCLDNYNRKLNRQS